MCYKATFRHGGEAIADYLVDADNPMAVLEDARQKAETIANIVRLNGGKQFRNLRSQDFEIHVDRHSVQIPLLELPAPTKPIFHTVDRRTCPCTECTRDRDLHEPGTYRATFFVTLGDQKITLASMERDGTARAVMEQAKDQLDTIVQVLKQDPVLRPYVSKPHLSIHLSLVEAQLSLVELAPKPEHRVEWMDYPMQPNPLRLPEEKKPRRKKETEDSPIQLEEEQ